MESFSKNQKVIHTPSKKELIVLNDKGFVKNGILFISCADVKTNDIDDYNTTQLISKHGNDFVYESFNHLLEHVERPRKLTEIEMNIAKCFWNEAIKATKKGLTLNQEK